MLGFFSIFFFAPFPKIYSFQASIGSDCGTPVQPPVSNRIDATPFAHSIHDPDFLYDGQLSEAEDASTAFVSSILSDKFTNQIINLDELNSDQLNQLHSHFKLVKQTNTQKMKSAINTKLFDKYMPLVDAKDVTEVFLPRYGLQKQNGKIRRFGQLKGYFKKQSTNGQTEILTEILEHIKSNTPGDSKPNANKKDGEPAKHQQAKEQRDDAAVPPKTFLLGRPIDYKLKKKRQSLEENFKLCKPEEAVPILKTLRQQQRKKFLSAIPMAEERASVDEPMELSQHLDDIEVLSEQTDSMQLDEEGSTADQLSQELSGVMLGDEEQELRNPMLEAGRKVHALLNTIEMEQCNKCNERWFDMGVGPQTGRCQRCSAEMHRFKEIPPMFSYENDMDPGPQPPCLARLNTVEAAAIARICPVQNIFKMKGGCVGQKGHSISFEQDVEGFAKSLPRKQSELPYIIIKAPNQTCTLRANAVYILEALEFLKEKNPFYRDIEIDHEVLSSYPSDRDTPLTGVRCHNTEEEVTGEALVSMMSDEDEEFLEPNVEDIAPSMAGAEVPQKTVREFIKEAVLQGSQEKERTVPWPRREKKPASEFREGFWSMAFPHLFPYGMADRTTTGRQNRTPEFLPWLQHLMRYHDGRFARDVRFVLFAVNAYRRHKGITVSNVYAKNLSAGTSMADVKEKVAQDDESIIQTLMHYGSGITGTAQYFKYEASRAVSMQRFLRMDSENKEMFNVFLTFSLADNHMPELHRLLPGSDKYLGKTLVKTMDDVPEGADPSEYITKAEDFRLRQKNLQENGHIVNYFGNKRLHLVMKYVLQGTLGVDFYFIRNEYQSRGSLHWHIVAHVPGLEAPVQKEALGKYRFDLSPADLEIDEDTEDSYELRLLRDHPVVTDEKQASVEESRRQLVEFTADHLGISAVHPQADPKLWPPPEGQAADAPEINCLREEDLDVFKNNDYTLTDLERLINRVNLHHCTKTYCLRYLAELLRYICRFRFPKELHGYCFETEKSLPDTESIVGLLQKHCASAGADISNGKVHVMRNHPRIVETIEELLIIWRANCDTKLIQSLEALMKYIMKYAMKKEQNSPSFDAVVKELTDKTASDTPVRKLFARILLKTIADHDMGYHEAHKIVEGKPHIEYSHGFKNVNLTDVRMLHIEAQADGAPATKKNPADIYWARETDENYQLFVENWTEEVYPVAPEDISLYAFTAYFTLSWTLMSKPLVPHLSPNFKYVPQVSNKKWRDRWCCTMLLAHKPGTHPKRYKGDFATSEEALQDFVENDDRCPPTLREEYMDSLKEQQEEEETEDLVGSQMSDVDEGSQDDEMLALGTRLVSGTAADMELEDDDTSEIGDDELALEQADVDWEKDRRELKLTPHLVSDVMDNWLITQKTNAQLPEEVRDEIDVSTLNPAQRRFYDVVCSAIDSGQRSLVDLSGAAGTGKSYAITAICQYAERKTGNKSTVLVTAPTGSAASLLPGGRTIHSLLKIRPEDGFKQHEEPLQGMALHRLQTTFRTTKVVIMDEKSMCGLGRLSQVHRRLCQAKESTEPFGGLTFVLCGDIRQLPPVQDLAIYSQEGGELAQREGRELYKLFDISIRLTESHRQKGDPVFAEQLEQMACGSYTKEDWASWKPRAFNKLPAEEQEKFMKTANKLCARRDDTKAFNITQMKKTGGEIFRINAIDEGPGAGSADSDKAKGLAKSVVLSRNSQVVLTSNLWQEAKLVNGSRGFVR